MFATGLTLQGVAARVEPAVAERLAGAVDDLDAAIRQIRSTIFELHQRWSHQPSLRADVLAVCHEASRALGFVPECVNPGPVDSVVDDDVREHVVLALREALSNVARHARAGHVTVDLETHSSELMLCVSDDGVGGVASLSAAGGFGALSAAAIRAGSGLANMHDRAAMLGGTLSLTDRPGGGTEVRWAVPLRS